MVQLSFTLPVPLSKVAEGAAEQLAHKMGLDPALVVHSKQIGTGHTFFVVYGRVSHLVDLSQVEVVERDYPLLAPPRRSTRPSSPGPAAGWWWWGPASGATPTRWGSTRSSTSRGSQARRAWSTTASSRW
ncbi:MAG: OAM dimerization domain-containing protein [Nocardioides sp.]